MKRFVKIAIWHVLYILCSCEPVRFRLEEEVLDPSVLVGQWSRIQDSTSIVTITEDYIDFYSDGQYVCEYSCLDFSPQYFILNMNRLWLDEDNVYKKNKCMSSISSDYKTLYMRWAIIKLYDNDEYYFEDVVLIKM